MFTLQVKLSKSDDTSEPSTASDSVMHSPSEIVNFDSDGAPTEETVKSRSRSINEQLAQVISFNYRLNSNWPSNTKYLVINER